MNDNQRRSIGIWAAGLKRVFDLLFSLALLLMVAPVLAVSLAAVFMSTGRPLFYSQPRTGRNGQPFMAVKIRTMAATHRHDPNEVVALQHDAVTPVGRWLRRLKIDELPQIWSVVTGEMSLIGPRPTIPEQTAAYDSFQRQRLEARPGLTGLAQVNGNASLSWEERIKYDVYYVRHVCLSLDVSIFLKTILIVTCGEQHFTRRFEESPYFHLQDGDPVA